MTQLVIAKLLHLCKFNKNNYRHWFIWTRNSKNGQELLVEFNKNLWTCSYLKSSQIKQIIEVTIKSHSTTRKIVKINTENLINIKMETVHNKFFHKLNNKFWGKSNKKSKERKYKCRKYKKNSKRTIERKEGEEDPKTNKTLIKTFDSLSNLFYKAKSYLEFL